MKPSIVSFSPGEVIFFGEHSAVYGRTAIASAISRGVEASASRSKGDEFLVESRLGNLRARLSRGGLSHFSADAAVAPLEGLFRRFLRKNPDFPPLSIKVKSEIPEQSGLASSAAVSSALLSLLWSAAGHELSSEELIQQVYQAELDIQKRGSLTGSATTVNGGFVRIHGAKWQKLSISPAGMNLAVVDTFERCETSVTTALVKERHDAQRAATEALFGEMDAIAREGESALAAGRVERVGELFSENQERLEALGVSTSKIRELCRRVDSYVFGSKITGAGGGGCVIALVKPGAEKAFAEAVEGAGCRLLDAKLRAEGVTVKAAEGVAP